MYKLCRICLIVTVLLALYLVALAVLFIPYGWVAGLVILIAMACRRGYYYSAYGTAAWADSPDLLHMTEGNGLIIGHHSARIAKIDGIRALFDSRLTARQACQKCIIAFQRKPPMLLLKLTRAIHTAVFAPTGAGKGVSLVVPHLLTCRDSMVVVDFKGENTMLTADARRAWGIML